MSDELKPDLVVPSISQREAAHEHARVVAAELSKRFGLSFMAAADGGTLCVGIKDAPVLLKAEPFTRG